MGLRVGALQRSQGRGEENHVTDPAASLRDKDSICGFHIHGVLEKGLANRKRDSPPSDDYRLVYIEQLNKISRGCQRNSPYWLGSDRGTVLARQDTNDEITSKYDVYFGAP